MTAYRDWVVELSNTTSTGDYDLDGPPPGTSYFKFRDRYADGEPTVVFWVVNPTRTKWEKNRLSRLDYGSPDTLTRTVVESTNDDDPVPWDEDDLPLRIYVAPDADASQGAITGWFASARHALLRFGSWFKKDDPTSGRHKWNIYDGTSDITVGVVDSGNHTVAMACMPAGVVLPFAGATVPPGFLLCFGQSLLRTDWALLFAAIGTTYGAADGTHFTLPDMRGRVAAGKTDMGGSNIARLSGSTISPNSTTLGGVSLLNDLNNVAVSATGSTGGSLSVGVGGTVFGGANPSGAEVAAAASGSGASSVAHDHAVSATGSMFGATTGSLFVAVNGSTGNFSIVQPTIILNQIISTGGV